MKKLRNKNQKGFTLIELLVVIAIIGLLASVVLLALNSARQKSRDAKRLADVRQLASALELYFNDKSAYPTGSASVASGGALLGAANTVNNPAPLTPTYIGLVPTAPGPQDTCSGANCDTACTTNGKGSNAYWYETNTTGSTYTLTFCLGAATGGYNGGQRVLTPAGIQ